MMARSRIRIEGKQGVMQDLGRKDFYLEIFGETRRKSENPLKRRKSRPESEDLRNFGVDLRFEKSLRGLERSLGVRVWRRRRNGG